MEAKMEIGKIEKGPVQILCDEIGFRFDRRMERSDILISFVRSIVSEIEQMRDMQDKLAHLTNKAPSLASGEVLERVRFMLAVGDTERMIADAALVHSLIHELQPDDAIPCDHLIDMASSCVSAIRFGLESPCRSRHAAEAANHVWKHVYGLSRFDTISANWGREWARDRLQSAILDLLPALT